jgi:phenazine biosynthesis protein phzE
VIAIRGGHFSGFQFHPEAILSRNGCNILREAIDPLLRQVRRTGEASM